MVSAGSSSSVSPSCSSFTIGQVYAPPASFTFRLGTIRQFAIFPTSPVITTSPVYLSALMKSGSLRSCVTWFGCTNITFSVLISSSNLSTASTIPL